MIGRHIKGGGTAYEHHMLRGQLHNLFIESSALGTVRIKGQLILQICLCAKDGECRTAGSMILKHADMSIFLCDSSKLGKNTVFHVANLSQVDTAICDVDIKTADS